MSAAKVQLFLQICKISAIFLANMKKKLYLCSVKHYLYAVV